MHTIVQATTWGIRTCFALLFILVPLILSPWNYELFEYNKMMITYALTALILGMWVLSMIANRQIRIRRTPLDIPILLFVVSQLISTLFSIDPHVSWFGYYSRFNGGMLSILTYVSLYYAFVSNFDLSMLSFRPPSRNPDSQNLDSRLRGNDKIMPPSPIYRLLKIMLLTGLGVSLYGIAEHFGIDKHLWVQDVQNRVFSTLGQPNWLAAYLIALIPVAMGFAMKSLNLSFPRPNLSFPSRLSRDKLRRESSTLSMDPRSQLRQGFDGQGKPEDDKKLSLSSIFYVLLSILFFLTLLWTRSRSGLLAFAITDAVFWLLVFLQGRPQKGETFKTFLITHVAFSLIVFFNGTYIEQIDRWVTMQAWQKRLSAISPSTSDMRQETTDTNATQSASSETELPTDTPLIESGVTDSGDIRKYVWQAAITTWKSSPKAFLIGTGTETFAFAFYQFKPVGHNLTSEWDFLYNKAHNEYLNFLATTGLFGLGTYLLLITSVIYWFLQVLRSWFLVHRKEKNAASMNHELSPINTALFSGWISILITNFFGFSVVITQIFFYLFPALMYVLHPTPNENKSIDFKLDWSVPLQKISMIGIGSIMTLIVISVGITWIGDKQFARGYNLSRSGYYPQAYQSLDKALRLNPNEPLYHDEQGNVLSTLALAALKENQATVSVELADMSIKKNDKALAISPNNVNFWKSRTKIFYTLSSFDPMYLKKAIEALEHALTLSPSDPKMYYNLAILYGQTGTSDIAISHMKKSIALKPNYKEGYVGLYLLYQELDQPELAKQTAQEYLTKVNPDDTEFQKFLE